MSVVAAKVYTDRIDIAADSILVRGWSTQIANGFSKLNKINGMIIGGSGSAQELSLMWHYMETHKPAAPTEKDMLAFVIEFSKWKRDLTGDGSMENLYIMAYDGHLFQVERMFVVEVTDYCAVGAGEDYARTALYLGHTPKEAVRAACELCCFVAEPIVELSMTKG